MSKNREKQYQHKVVRIVDGKSVTFFTPQYIAELTPVEKRLPEQRGDNMQPAHATYRKRAAEDVS